MGGLIISIDLYIYFKLLWILKMDKIISTSGGGDKYGFTEVKIKQEYDIECIEIKQEPEEDNIHGARQVKGCVSQWVDSYVTIKEENVDKNVCTFPAVCKAEEESGDIHESAGIRNKTVQVNLLNEESVVQGEYSTGYVKVKEEHAQEETKSTSQDHCMTEVETPAFHQGIKLLGSIYMVSRSTTKNSIGNKKMDLGKVDLGKYVNVTYKCEVCDKEFGHHSTLKQHLLLNHKKPIDLGQEQPSTEDKNMDCCSTSTTPDTNCPSSKATNMENPVVNAQTGSSSKGLADQDKREDLSVCACSCGGFSKSQDYYTEVQTKLLMRRWLIAEVETGKVPGVEWLDSKKTLLKIPWTHGSRHNFDAGTDSCLFKKWAAHTGRIGPLDQSYGHAKKWKANFRCALNSLPDVAEEKTMSVSRGIHARKVYKFLPEQPRKNSYKVEAMKSTIQSTIRNTTMKKLHQFLEQNKQGRPPGQGNTGSSPTPREQDGQTLAENIHQCKDCGKALPPAGTRLNVKIKALTGEKLHKCNICKKAFAHSNSLRRHMITHTSENKCDICRA